MNLNIGEGQFTPEDSLSSELDRGDATARALVEHLKRMGAANMHRVVGGFKVSVEPADLPPPHDSQEEAQRAAGIWPWAAPGDDAHRDVPFLFHPRTGNPLLTPSHHTRRTSAFKVWDFNPWTGVERLREDVEADPQGLTLRPPRWPVFAAPKPSALDEMAAQAASWRGRSAEVAARDVKPTGIDATLAERGSRYGRFEDHSEVSQALKKVVFTKRPRETLATDQVEALEMICHKLGRIVNGDPNYADSWVDIAGYAKLVADRLEGVSR